MCIREKIYFIIVKKRLHNMKLTSLIVHMLEIIIVTTMSPEMWQERI